MANYKKYDYAQMVMIPVSLENQLMPGTLEHAIHEVIEKKVDLSLFNEKYKNDETGAPAHGVIQGYNAQALVDDKHQIIVHAVAMSDGQDHENLSPMLDGAKEADCRECPLRSKCLARKNGKARRLATIEPVFANIRSQKRLDRFTYRGKVKVNIQWMLYCMVHNIEKIMNYGLTG